MRRSKHIAALVGASFLVSACGMSSLPSLDTSQLFPTPAETSQNIETLKSPYPSQSTFQVLYTQQYADKTITGTGYVQYAGNSCALSMEYSETTPEGTTPLYLMRKTYEEPLYIQTAQDPQPQWLDVRNPASTEILQHSLPVSILPGAVADPDRYDLCALPSASDLINQQTGEWDISKYKTYQSEALTDWVGALDILPPELMELFGAETTPDSLSSLLGESTQELQEALPDTVIVEALTPYTPAIITELGEGKIYQFGEKNNFYTEIVLTPIQGETITIAPPEGAVPYDVSGGLAPEGVNVEELFTTLLGS